VKPIPIAVANSPRLRNELKLHEWRKLKTLRLCRPTIRIRQRLIRRLDSVLILNESAAVVW
jgi:hypothetical protein